MEMYMRKSPKPVSLLSVAVGAGTASPTVPKSPSPRPLIPQISEPVEVEEIASLSPVWDPLSNGTGSEEVEMDTLSADGSTRPTPLTPVLESPSASASRSGGVLDTAPTPSCTRTRFKSEPAVLSCREEVRKGKVKRSDSRGSNIIEETEPGHDLTVRRGSKKYPKQGSKELLLGERRGSTPFKKLAARRGSKMSEDGAHTMPKRTRKESVLGPVSKIVPHLRKQSTILPPLPTQDIQVLEKLMYEYDPRTRTDEGILRLCKEIKEKWSGTMTPPMQYGLNDAWNKINQAETMKVEFAIRSNVTFNGLHDDDSPIHGKAVTFRARDCLHIKAQFNEDWWIGRVVKCDAPIGFVPTPMKLKKLVSETLNQQINNKDTNTLKKTHSFDKDHKKTTSSQDVSDKLDGSTENISHIAQTRISEKDLKAQGPYEAIPLIRPIVLCGPSLRNFDVTDLMHKALFHALKRAFGDRMEVVHIEEKWLKPFHNALANKHLVGTTEAMDHVMQQVFTASQSFKLLFIDLKVNSPTALKRSPIAPLLVHIKIANMKILQNLIKSRGADQKRSSAAQVYTAQKLCDLDKRVFDVVLKECNFEDAADHLITYLNKYYDASRPTQTPKRSDQLLRSSLNPNIMKGLVVKSPFGSRRNNSKRDKERNQLDSPRGNEIVAKG